MTIKNTSPVISAQNSKNNSEENFEAIEYKMPKQQEADLQKAIQEGKVKELIDFWSKDHSKEKYELFKFYANFDKQIDQKDQKNLNLKQIIKLQTAIITENESKHQYQVNDLIRSLENHKQEIQLIKKNAIGNSSVDQSKEIAKQEKEIQQLKEAMELNMKQESELNQLKYSLEQIAQQEKDLKELKKILQEKSEQEDEIKQLKQNLELKEQQIKILQENQFSQNNQIQELEQIQESVILSQIENQDEQYKSKNSDDQPKSQIGNFTSSQSILYDSRFSMRSSLICSTITKVIPAQVLVTRQLSPVKLSTITQIATVNRISPARYISPVRSISPISTPIVIVQQQPTVIRQKLN